MDTFPAGKCYTMEYPRPPSSLGEQPSNAFLIQKLKRQLREEEPDLSQAELKRLCRAQLPESRSNDDYIGKILDELGDGRMSRELFQLVLDDPRYQASVKNGALRFEDYDDPSDS